MPKAILCATGGGEWYTYPAVARTFFGLVCCPLVSVSQSSSAYSVHLTRVGTHAWLKLSHVVCFLFTLDYSPFMSYFPPCLPFPDGHFETTFLTLTATSWTSPTTTSLPSHLTNLKSAKYVHSAPSDMASGHLADTPLTTGYEPKLVHDLKKKSISEDSDATPIDNQNLDNFSEFSRVTRCAD